MHKKAKRWESVNLPRPWAKPFGFANLKHQLLLWPARVLVVVTVQIWEADVIRFPIQSAIQGAGENRAKIRSLAEKSLEAPVLTECHSHQIQHISVFFACIFSCQRHRTPL